MLLILRQLPHCLYGSYMYILHWMCTVTLYRGLWGRGRGRKGICTCLCASKATDLAIKHSSKCTMKMMGSFFCGYQVRRQGLLGLDTCIWRFVVLNIDNNVACYSVAMMALVSLADSESKQLLIILHYNGASSNFLCQCCNKTHEKKQYNIICMFHVHTFNWTPPFPTVYPTGLDVTSVNMRSTMKPHNNYSINIINCLHVKLCWF